MNKQRNSNEYGQILVIFVVALIVLLGFLALIIDGGNLFLQRRAAQNAADAGAMAGAAELCLPDNYSFPSPEYAAISYATNENTADVAYPQVDGEHGVVTVTTQISSSSFFAHFVGFPELTAQASASASCCPATTGAGVLPIAWACRTPISSTVTDLTDCSENAITYSQVISYVNNPVLPIPKELYIVMDSVAEPGDLAAICDSDFGWLDCDLDNDGDDDLIANGGRSWLDLDGAGGGSSELVSWINNGFPDEINTPIWVGGQSGVANNVFQNAGGKVGEIVTVPVFDSICDDYPTTACGLKDGDDIITTAGGLYYHRVIGFAAFYITCVDAPGLGTSCPGKDYAVDLGAIAANTKTIEGFFVKDIIPDLTDMDCDSGVYTGAFVMRLTK
jgi:Flp pilus assembly protein TadG